HNQACADALITLLTESWSLGEAPEHLQRYSRQLDSISTRTHYRRARAYVFLAEAQYAEKRSNPALRKASYDALETTSALANDTLGLALAEYYVAALHFYTADYNLAIQYYKQALERFQALRNLPHSAWTLYRLAIVYGYTGNYVASIAHQFKALRIFEQLDITHGIASSNADLGIALLQIGSTEKSLEYFTKALEVYQGSQNQHSQEALAEILAYIASAQYRRKVLIESLNYLGKAQEYTARPSTLRGVVARSTVYDVLGSIAQGQGNIALAQEYFWKAFHILNSNGIQGNDLSYALYRMASLYFEQGEIQESERIFRIMLERALKGSDRRNAARSMLWLGRIALAQQQYSTAEQYARKSLAAAQEIGQLEFARASAELLATLCEKLHKLEISLYYAKLARHYHDSIFTLEREQQLAGMEALYNLDRERIQLENLRRDSEIQMLTAQRLQLLLWGSVATSIVVIVFLIVVWRTNQRRRLANEQLARQTERIRALTRISVEIASNLDIESLIVMIYGYLNQLMDAPIFNIGDYLPEREGIQMRYLIENGEFLEPPFVSMHDAHRPAVRCVKSRSPVVINDGSIPVLVGAKPESLVYIPLVSGDEVIGVFSVQSFKQQSYPPENVDLLVAISSSIATAITNAKAFARIKAQQLELEYQASLIQLRNAELSERNLHLEQLTNKIRENIAYARTIQQAVLPTEQELCERLGEYFVLYRPMEIVSGDFYWMQHTEFATLVAVVDCTGHGIPGAFMSMIGNDLLNQIVLEKNITNPAWILTELHYAVRQVLRQTNDLSSNQDSMDMCLCRIDETGVTFAGARRPLYIVQSGEIIILEGNTKPIGGFQREPRRLFSAQRVNFPTDTSLMLYLTTDGFADQHNPDREKFGTQRLTALLKDIAYHDATTQYAMLLHALEQHQGSAQQRDDITVLGIRATPTSCLVR
ncbi:MAG: tetratricopeptide repeat protein, partial [Bacteroidota bacterium]|nr:tetratricopeptide repeat protein [Candidatus Kapabacteria bacterium]MDW8220925.1 tetratricopeptide repeat protein [Bacteroidota bacterium]